MNVSGNLAFTERQTGNYSMMIEELGHDCLYRIPGTDPPWTTRLRTERSTLRHAVLLCLPSRCALWLLDGGTESNLDARKSARLRRSRRGDQSAAMDQRHRVWPLRRTVGRIGARSRPPVGLPHREPTISMVGARVRKDRRSGQRAAARSRLFSHPVRAESRGIAQRSSFRSARRSETVRALSMPRSGMRSTTRSE